MNSLLVFALALSAASAVDLQWRIIGGQKADDGQFPYQASLQKNNVHFCGGSIVNIYWVLTAAQCFDNGITGAITVVVGSNQLTVGGVQHQVQRIVKHAGYAKTHLHNDIALLRVERPMQLSAKVQPISLNTANIDSGFTLTLSGWGLTANPGYIQNFLQFISVSSISLTKCSRIYQSSGYTISVTQICTSTQQHRGVCAGDTGGPLVHQGELVGVMSWGRPCATGVPDVHTRVSEYINWIIQNMY